MALAVPPNDDTNEPPNVAPIHKGSFKRDGMGFIQVLPRYDAAIHIDYIQHRGAELHGEVTVKLADRVIYMSKVNLSDGNNRWRYAESVNRVTKRILQRDDIPWQQLVDDFCFSILQYERKGERVQRVARMAFIDPIQYIVEKLIIEGKTNSIIAPGGSGKGQLSIALAICMMTGRDLAGLRVGKARPIYFDWEDDFQTFQARANVIANGMGIDPPEIPYVKMRGAMPDKINTMARYIQEEDANVGFIDSFSVAGGTTAGGAWDTIAHRAFDALEMVRVPGGMTWFIVDHVAAAAINDTEPGGKAFGSIQKMNRVRNAWQMRAEQEEGSPTSHMTFFDAKWNHTGLRKKFGIRMDFAQDAVAFTSEEPVMAKQVEDADVVADRMQRELAGGDRLSTGVLALSLGIDPAAVAEAYHMNGDLFVKDEMGFISLTGSAGVEDDEPF